MSTHTQGPWMVSRYSQSTVLKAISIRGANERIARVVVPDTAQSISEYVANARLIAAAPDLLEALEDAASTQPADSPIKWVLRARAAIAKAKGDS